MTCPGCPSHPPTRSARPPRWSAPTSPAYERAFGLPVRRPVRVRAVRSRPDGRLDVHSDNDTWTARALINATGTWTRPFWPHYPGRSSFRGQQLHTADYRGPAEFAGRRVVVVGGGTSAVQLLAEISPVAASTTWVTRRPPALPSEEFGPELGRAAVARVDDRGTRRTATGQRGGRDRSAAHPRVRRLREDGVLERLPIFDRITPDGVTWADGRFVGGRRILWCTGFRAALDHLAPLRAARAGRWYHDGRHPCGRRRADSPDRLRPRRRARSAPTGPAARRSTRFARCSHPPPLSTDVALFDGSPDSGHRGQGRGPQLPRSRRDGDARSPLLPSPTCARAGADCPVCAKCDRVPIIHEEFRTCSP